MPVTRRAIFDCCSLTSSFSETTEAKAATIVEAARSQIGVTRSYDPAYRSMSYPGGDVDASTGVCTDVVIRALRKSLKFDLQKEVHEDMRSLFSRYPKKLGTFAHRPEHRPPSGAKLAYLFLPKGMEATDPQQILRIPGG